MNVSVNLKKSLATTWIFFPPFWHCRSLGGEHSSGRPTLSTRSGVHEVHTLGRDRNHIFQLCGCLLGLQVGEPPVAEALERAVSNHCTKMLHVPHKGVQIRHLRTFHCYLPSRKRKNHLKRKRLVLFFVFIVGIYVEDTLAEILTERRNWNLTFLILNLYPQSGRTSQSHGSPSICGGWIGWSGERNFDTFEAKN